MLNLVEKRKGVVCYQPFYEKGKKAECVVIVREKDAEDAWSILQPAFIEWSEQPVFTEWSELEAGINGDGPEMPLGDWLKEAMDRAGIECEVYANREVVAGDRRFVDVDKIIGKLNERISDFIVKHPEKKGCVEVEGIRELIHILELEAEND